MKLGGAGQAKTLSAGLMVRSQPELSQSSSSLNSQPHRGIVVRGGHSEAVPDLCPYLYCPFSCLESVLTLYIPSFTLKKKCALCIMYLKPTFTFYGCTMKETGATEHPRIPAKETRTVLPGAQSPLHCCGFFFPL